MKIYANTRKVTIEDKQELTSGGYQDLTIDVELSKEYENLNNYVTFGNISVPIIDNQVKTPLLNVGICKIGVYGYEGKDKLVLRYSPIGVDVLVKKGSYTDKTANQTVPTPTEFEKCVDELRSIVEKSTIKDNSISTSKIQDFAITSNKIAEQSITKLKLSEELSREINNKAESKDIPTKITQLDNDTHFKEYVEILDETTANSYVSLDGDKHKKLQSSDFYIAFFPNEISTQHSYNCTISGQVHKTNTDNEYVIMKLNGTAIGNNEILLNDDNQADISLTVNNSDFNYGGTSSYRVLIGKPYVSNGFSIASDWDSSKGEEMKGDSLLSDKSSTNKNYNCYIEKQGDMSNCTVSSLIKFQKHERSGLTYKWTTKDEQVLTIDFQVAKEKDDDKLKGLYFISSSQTLLLSANSDLADKLQLVENQLDNCVKKNESLKLIGEVVFDGSQSNTEYEFPLTNDFYNVYVICDDLTSNQLSDCNIYVNILGSTSISLAGNQFIGKQNTKKSGMFRLERMGEFLQGWSENLSDDKITYAKIQKVNRVDNLTISFDECIPNSGKISIYYS